MGNLQTPKLLPEVWVLPDYPAYRNEFITGVGITNDVPSDEFQVDHWMSKGQIEDKLRSTVYLRVILIDASTNKSHGASMERFAANNIEIPITHTKDLEYINVAPFLKSMGVRFTKGRYKKQTEYVRILDTLLRLGFANDKIIAEKMVNTYFNLNVNGEYDDLRE